MAGAGSTMAGLSYIIYISNPYFFGCYILSLRTLSMEPRFHALIVSRLALACLLTSRGGLLAYLLPLWAG